MPPGRAGALLGERETPPRPTIVVDSAARCVEALRFCTAPHGSDLWRIIMVMCCRQNGLALAFANNNQMNNGKNGSSFSSSGSSGIGAGCDDKELLLLACAEDAAALAFASSRLRGDLEVVRAAVETGGGDPARRYGRPAEVHSF